MPESHATLAGDGLRFREIGDNASGSLKGEEHTQIRAQNEGNRSGNPKPPSRIEGGIVSF
jgi:hypothetical protein